MAGPIDRVFMSSDHQTLNHGAREYLNAAGFTTNNVENFFGVFKRSGQGQWLATQVKRVLDLLDLVQQTRQKPMGEGRQRVVG
jgi:hypothetical protein